MIFALPGIAAVVLGRRATQLGLSRGRRPAVVGAVIALGFGGLNALAYLGQRMGG